MTMLVGLAVIVLVVNLAFIIWGSRGDPYEPPKERKPSSIYTPTYERHRVTKSSYWLEVELQRVRLRKENEPVADRITELRLDALETGKPLDPIALIEEALQAVTKGCCIDKSYSGGYPTSYPNPHGILAVRLLNLALKRLKADAPSD